MEMSVRNFLFSSVCPSSDAVSVFIKECLNPHYHAFIWPCSVVLGQFVYWWYANNKTPIAAFGDEFVVTEIGAGCSLPLLLFAKLLKTDANSLKKFPRLIATDGHEYFDRFADQLKSNCGQNGVCFMSAGDNNSDELVVECYPLSWGHLPKDLPSSVTTSKRKILLCADCFYDSKDFEDVVVTISYQLHCGCFKNEGESKFNECWCAVQIRSTNHSIGYLLKKWHLSFERISLKEFGADSNSLANSPLPGQSIVEMYIFKPTFD